MTPNLLTRAPAKKKRKKDIQVNNINGDARRAINKVVIVIYRQS